MASKVAHPRRGTDGCASRRKEGSREVRPSGSGCHGGKLLKLTAYLSEREAIGVTRIFGDDCRATLHGSRLCDTFRLRIARPWIECSAA